MIPDSQIDGALSPYGFESTPELNDKIRTYIALILKWNRSIRSSLPVAGQFESKVSLKSPGLEKWTAQSATTLIRFGE